MLMLRTRHANGMRRLCAKLNPILSKFITLVGAPSGMRSCHGRVEVGARFVYILHNVLA